MDDVDVEFPPFEAAELEDTPPAEKKTRRRRSDAGQPRGARSGAGSRAPRATTTKKLEEDLLVPIAMFSRGIALALPTTGAVLMARGEQTSRAIVRFASSRPKMLEALKRGSEIGPTVEVAETLAMCFIAAQLDLGRMDPGSPIAQLTGVSAIYEEMHEHMTPAGGNPGEQPVTPDPMAGGFNNIQPEPPSPPVYQNPRFNDDGTYTAPPTYKAGESAYIHDITKDEFGNTVRNNE